MTPLDGLIRKEIADRGPMGLDRYMALCLTHPEHGYYTTRNPLGASGDFTTAPEISQMFGELLGLWLAQMWVDQGRPSRATLAELGPGRGTLMADIWRSCGRVPGFHDAMTLAMLETSPILRDACTQAMSPTPIQFVSGLRDLPEHPLFVVANEFFDALPIRQFQLVDTTWFERCVGVTGDGLAMKHLPLSGPPPGVQPALLPDGAIIETSVATTDIATELGARIKAHGGAALIVDYGDWEGGGDTLQAVRRHETADIFSAPGETDLTAHVQFSSLAAATHLPHAFAPQGAFLERLGITARANQLLSATTADGAETIIAAHRRLTHPEEMGTLFKVLALGPDVSDQTAGFAP